MTTDIWDENHFSRARDFLDSIPPDAPGRDEAVKHIDDCELLAERLAAGSELLFFFGLAARASALLLVCHARGIAVENELANIIGATGGRNDG